MEIAELRGIDEEEILEWPIDKLARWVAYVERKRKQEAREEKRHITTQSPFPMLRRRAR